MHGASETRVLVIRGRGTDLLLLALERSKELLLRSEFRDRATTIKAKVRIDHCKDKGQVTIATSLDN